MISRRSLFAALSAPFLAPLVKWAGRKNAGPVLADIGAGVEAMEAKYPTTLESLDSYGFRWDPNAPPEKRLEVYQNGESVGYADTWARGVGADGVQILEGFFVSMKEPA